MRTDPYQWIARIYNALFEPLLRPVRRMGLELYSPKRGMVVLDIGCGTGAFLKLCSATGAALLGIDQSPAMLTQAKKRLAEEALLVLGDGSAMPYPDSSLDLIILSMTLHELSDETRKGVLLEARRVLKDDGTILVMDYHSGPLEFPGGWIARALIAPIERMAGREHSRHQRAYLSAGGVPALAAAYGFTVEKRRLIRGRSFGLFLLRRGSIGRLSGE
jgi:ubiquinone/menaquinone biosynthesis C-methylase UbiE